MKAVPRMVQVESANLHSVGYDLDMGQLCVTFVADPSLLYRYSNVGPEMFIELLNAQSAGQLFNDTIRRDPKVFPYTKEEL